MKNHSGKRLGIYNLLRNPFSINEWEKSLEEIAAKCGYKYIRYGTVHSGVSTIASIENTLQY
jgi:hypothetical protein